MTPLGFKGPGLPQGGHLEPGARTNEGLLKRPCALRLRKCCGCELAMFLWGMLVGKTFGEYKLSWATPHFVYTKMVAISITNRISLSSGAHATLECMLF